MNKFDFLKKALAAGMIASAVMLAGCEADGNASEAGGIGSGDPNDPGTLFPNDGTTGGNITEGGTPIAGGDTGFNFICEASAKAFGVPSTEAGSGGLIGGPLTALLELLGGSSLTQLLNSVKDKELVIDGELESHSTFTLTLGLLGGLLSSVDQTVRLGGVAGAGNYAVFGVSFPVATLELSLGNSIIVTTYRKVGIVDVQQETVTLPVTSLDLLGLVGGGRAFVGVKATKDYDRVTIGLTPGLLSANVGEAMFVHELCTKGRLVAAP